MGAAQCCGPPSITGDSLQTAVVVSREGDALGDKFPPMLNGKGDDDTLKESTDTSKTKSNIDSLELKDEEFPDKEFVAPAPDKQEPVNLGVAGSPPEPYKISQASEIKPLGTKGPAQPKAPNVMERRLLFWIWNLVRTGFSQSLDKEHLPELLSFLKAKDIAVKAEELWAAQTQKSSSKWSFAIVLYRMNRKYILLGILANSLHGLCSGFVKPFMLRQVITNVEHLTLRDVMLLAGVLYFEALMQLWMKQTMADEVLPGVFATGSSLLAQRMPHVAQDVQADDGQKIVAEPQLIAQDLTRTLENSIMLYMIPSAVVQLISACVTLNLFLGPAAWIGIGYCSLAVFISAQNARFNKRVDKKGLEAADVRVVMLRQILEGIRFIKLAGWEDSYLAKMSGFRKVETGHHRKFRSHEMMGAAIGRTTPAVAAMLTFVLLAVAGQPLKPADVFAALSIFLSLRLPLGVLPGAFVLVNSISLSLQRINRTLSQRQAVTPPVPETDTLAVSMKDAEFRWTPEGSPALRGISFTVAWGQMTAVVGAVASGKSTLVTGILGGLQAASGNAALCRDAVAYIPQKPVVFSGTILMNITMGHEYTESRLASALKAASFSRDLELMPHGLATEIGERGTTLSGGQQMRLNIARAFYHQPNLIVADDPLAAVDVHVASAIFATLQQWTRHEGEQAAAKPRRAAVMAMNQLHLIPNFDHVLYLEANTIACQGSPAEVESASRSIPKLASLLESARTAMTIDEVAIDLSTDSDAAPETPAATVQELPADKPSEPVSKDSSAQSGTPARLSMLAVGNQEPSNLFKAEHRHRGALVQSIWLQYLRAVGPFWLSMYGGCLTVAYGLLASNDWWLARWMQKTQDGENDDSVDCPIYAALALSHVIFMVTLCFVSGSAGAHASQHLHRLCMSHMLRAPLSWYEATPSGRTISRMSSDLVAVDLKLPSIFDHFCQMCIMIVILVVTICVMVPWILILVTMLLPLYVLLDVAINRSSREVKRMQNTAMSPVLTLVQEAAQSRLLLRVTGQGQWLLERTRVCVDDYNCSFFVSQSLMGFLRFIGTCIGVIVSVVLTFLLWAYPSLVEMTPGGPVTLGLALTYSFVIPYFLSFVSLFWSMLRLFMASLERLLELQSDLVPQEKAWHCPSDPAVNWVSMGKIEFKSATMCYRPGLPPAVNQLSLTVAGGERLGVVGRTGAGKTSLSVLLLRVVELTDGAVLIDNIDVGQIGLQVLRKAIAVVPQDPFLFKGSVSQNLDPLNSLKPEALRSALKGVGLNLELEDDVGAGGESLSSGERQLIAIARATLSSARIVVMDEPTASCDAQKDAQLQELIRVAFSQRTVLCIAHRLNTIISYDRILVMEAGSAVELDTPKALMADPSTRFAQMVAGMQDDKDPVQV